MEVISTAKLVDKRVFPPSTSSAPERAGRTADPEEELSRTWILRRSSIRSRRRRPWNCSPTSLQSSATTRSSSQYELHLIAHTKRVRVPHISILRCGVFI